MKAFACLLIVFVLIITLGCASTGDKAKQPSNTDPLQSLALMRQGSVAFQQEHYTEALRLFEEAVAITPSNGTIYNMIGLCKMRLNQFTESMEAFNTALRMIPAFTDARNNRGTVYLQLEQYQLAEVDFLAVLGDTTYPHHWEAYYNLGLANLGQGQLGAAEENFRRAITAPLPVFAAYLRLAEIKQQQGDIKSAIDLLHDATLKFPDRLQASLALGRTLMQAGRKDEAETHLKKIVQSYPGSPIAVEAAALLEDL